MNNKEKYKTELKKFRKEINLKVQQCKTVEEQLYELKTRYFNLLVVIKKIIRKKKKGKSNTEQKKMNGNPIDTKAKIERMNIKRK